MENITEVDIQPDTQHNDIKEDIKYDNLEDVINSGINNNIIEKKEKPRILDSKIQEINGIKYKVLFINKETDERKFLNALQHTIESGVLPLVKVIGNQSTFKLVKCIATLNGILADRYSIHWRVFWTKDKGAKDGAEISIINFLGLFK